MSVFRMEEVLKVYNNKKEDKKITIGLKDISFEINQGESVAFVGHNGCGKTTIINILTGIQKATKGKVFINDKEIENKSHMNKDMVLCMSNGFGLVESMTVKQFILFKSYLYGVKPDFNNYYFNMLNISTIINRKISVCSSGEKQRISLYTSLISNPKTILFDEPTSNLDIETRFFFMDLIKILKKEKKTIILVSHQIEEIEMMDRLIQMSHGEIKSDGPNVRKGSREENISELEKILRNICQINREVAV